MKIKFLHLLCLCVIAMSVATSSPVQAQGAADPYQSWLSVTALLKSKGIEPTQVNWQPIDRMCVALKSPNSNSFYNKCKFEKARDQHMHRLDRGQCGTRALAQYPDRLASQDTVQLLREKDASGQVHVYDRVIKPISAKELESLRYSTVIQCMQEVGWLSAEDPFSGKRCE